MPSGKIKKVVQEKGFGFIQPQSGADVFFHHTSVADGSFESMSEGQQVEFEVEQGGSRGGKGPRATSVKSA
jgi:CspA family cold shock protein